MRKFILRGVLSLTGFMAGLFSLGVLGGWQVVIQTVVLGLVIGSCGAFLFRRSKLGAAPLWGGLAVALVSTILGVFVVGFNAEDWNNELGKAPYGLDDLFWFAFYGAIAGVALGCMVARADCSRAPDEGRNGRDWEKPN